MSNLVNRTARAAITAGLGLALAVGGALAPATTAMADTGTITITQTTNADATYDGYRIFAADIADDDRTTHVAWASDEAKAAVLAFLDESGYADWLLQNHPGDDQHDRAQVAAEYVTASIAGGTEEEDVTEAQDDVDGEESTEVSVTKPSTPEGRSFATRLAVAVASAGIEPVVVASGEEYEGKEGLWLFVTSAETAEGYGDAGTAPLWVPVGGSVSKVEEKSAAPSVTKEVREDSTGKWGKSADAANGEDLEYRLTGTMPSNIAAYSSYHYMFTDTLSSGLTIDVPSGKSIADVITVKVDGQAVKVDGEALRRPTRATSSPSSSPTCSRTSGRPSASTPRPRSPSATRRT